MTLQMFVYSFQNITPFDCYIIQIEVILGTQTCSYFLYMELHRTITIIIEYTTHHPIQYMPSSRSFYTFILESSGALMLTDPPSMSMVDGGVI